MSGCAVCGDRVNGSRYGAPACLGCIVFFRRAIINDVNYKCLKGENCPITNESRCICRFCRLQKCFTVGMKAAAIQRRDVMGPRKSKNMPAPQIIKEERFSPVCTPVASTSGTSSNVTISSTGGLIDKLMRLQEHQWSCHRSYFCMGENFSMGADMFDDIKLRIQGENFRRARSGDVNTMIRLGIVDAVRWANQFEIFRSLHNHHKKSILSEYAFAFMLVDQGYLTSQREEDDLWMLQNNTYMHSDYFKGLPEADKRLDMVHTKAKLHPHFVKDALQSVGLPMKALVIDTFECAVLKTILLFGHKNFFLESREMLQQLESRCILELTDHCKKKYQKDAAVRVGTVILFTASIRCSIMAVYNQTRVSDLFNLMTFDPLVKDVFLS
ncbi:unnamed protein product [Caenorhabditis auriculariae]|uniref:Nuclear receptor domain-containing protein n=1 Tax=Caenorhabditis auriculariae TaxID=2777116 RepID=A0A8S1HGX9_9PELO|nr:unnamed protein product [Caenorhabditis auriculariae]